LIVKTAKIATKTTIGIKRVIMTNLMVFIVGSKKGISKDIIKYKTIDKKARDNRMSANLKKSKITSFLAFMG
jgi:hypothetical protein